MFDFQKGNLPNHFDDFFTLNKQVCMNTIQEIQAVYTNNILELTISRLSIRTKGIDLWNSIPC